MSFFITNVNSFKQFLHRGSNKIFSASIVKISKFTLNEDVLHSKWALTSRALMYIILSYVTIMNI